MSKLVKMEAGPDADVLRAFTADQLKEKLDDLEKQLAKTEEHDKITKTILSSNITAINDVLEGKKEISDKLAANKGNKEALRTIYFDMDEQDMLVSKYQTTIFQQVQSTDYTCKGRI